MKKINVIKMSMVAALILTGVNAAQADNSVQVTGSVAAVGCAVNVDQTSVNLTSAKPADITTANKLFSSKDVTVTTSQCSGGVDGTSIPKLRVTGPASSLGASFFNTESNPSFGIGIQKDGTTTLLSNNDFVSLGNATTTPTVLEGVGTKFNVGYNSPTATPAAGLAKATLTFDFLYN